MFNPIQNNQTKTSEKLPGPLINTLFQNKQGKRGFCAQLVPFRETTQKNKRMIYLLLEDFSTAFLLVPASLASLDFFRAGFSGCASIFGSLAGTVVTIRVTSTLNPPILHFLVQKYIFYYLYLVGLYSTG